MIADKALVLLRHLTPTEVVIHDLISETPSGVIFDVCIVGAGAAGISLAVELLSRGKHVILLEGGGAALDEGSQEPYISEVSGLHHRGTHEGRFRVHGGTTTKWGGQILELDATDFEHRSWIQGSGWPFPKSELTTFYSRALQLEGLADSILSDSNVWEALGESKPRLPGLLPYLSRWCPEPNFARLHREALEGPNIDVWLHANAVELVLEEGRATGVRTATQTGKHATFRAREFVFSMGAIESSRFFLQPRQGRLPWNNSGLLGKNFQDHIDCNAASVLSKNPHELHRMFDSIFLHGHKYHPKMKLPADTARTEETLNTAATLAFESPSAEDLATSRTLAKNLLRGRLSQIQLSDLGGTLRQIPAVVRQSYRYAVQHRSYQPSDAAISLRVHCEQEPCSRSSVTLSDQRDSLGLYRTRLSWSISSRELRSIRRFVDHARTALAGVADVIPNPALDSDEALTALCEDSFHHMGGMRMNDSPSLGVVSSDLRLHGTHNAYVCSSAVFPTSGFSNPTHTLIALAVRLAAHLSRN